MTDPVGYGYSAEIQSSHSGILRVSRTKEGVFDTPLYTAPSAPDSAVCTDVHHFVERNGKWVCQYCGLKPFYMNSPAPSAPDSAVREAIKEAHENLKAGIEKVIPMCPPTALIPIELHTAAQILFHLLEDKENG